MGAGAGATPTPTRAAHDPTAHVHGADSAMAAGAAGDEDGEGMAEHTHGPNLPEVAAASDDERARAEALWKASEANAERWRDPDAAVAAGFRFKDEDDKAGPGRRVRFRRGHPAWRADGGCSTRPARDAVYWTARRRPDLVGRHVTPRPGEPPAHRGGPITAGTTRLPRSRNPGKAGPAVDGMPEARSTGAAAR